MSKKPLTAGDFIDARCTRCRVITNHTIVAMVVDKIARVQCNTCNGIHNYHTPKGPSDKKPRPVAAPTSTAVRSTRKAMAAAVSADLQEWAALSTHADVSRAIPYDMERGFKVNDLLIHPSFGVGLVKVVSKPNKMEVLFEDGKKLLRCRI